MTVPGRRLIWLAFAVLLPLATAGGLRPDWAAPCWGLAAALMAAAAADAVAATRRLRRFELSAPESMRLTKDVPADLPISIDNASDATERLRIAIAMPEGIEVGQVTNLRPIANRPSGRAVDSGRRVDNPPQVGNLPHNGFMDVEVPAGRSRIEWPCSGVQRGDHRVSDAYIQMASPLGFWQVSAARPIDCTLRVYPNLRDSATAGLFLKTQNMGIRMYRQVGKGREFENLRQYLSGDSFEDIHWKATARRRFPTVKQYRVEHAQEVYAVIDHSRLMARSGILESYVDAALHLALVAERQGDRFGLVSFSDRARRFVRARSGLEHFRLCRETIYNLRAERVSPDFRDVFSNLQLNLRRRALLIFFTALDDSLLAEIFEHAVPMVARRHVVLVNVARTEDMQPLWGQPFGAAAALPRGVPGQASGDGNAGTKPGGSPEGLTPPADLNEAYRGLAGQMLVTRMRKLEIALANRGVKLAMIDPERIKTAVTKQYLEIKRRQLL